jgi:small subunit ribosomal protein S6e
MVFKINISDKGKTLKLETESEVVVGKAIGETIKGSDISADLDGYELLITGTSDISGFPGKKDLEGASYHRELLTKGFAMKNTQKGLRLRKTLRGEEVSLKTSQINTKVIKQGDKKFSELMPKKEGGEEENKEEKPEEKKEEVKPETEKPAEEEKKEEEKPAEEKPEEKPAEKKE